MNPDTQPVSGVDDIEVETHDEGFTLHLIRRDGSGIALPLEPEDYEAIQTMFMLLMDHRKLRPFGGGCVE